MHYKKLWWREQNGIHIWSMAPFMTKQVLWISDMCLRTPSPSRERIWRVAWEKEQWLKWEGIKLNCATFKVLSKFWPISKHYIIVTIEKCFSIPNTFIQIWNTFLLSHLKRLDMFLKLSSLICFNIFSVPTVPRHGCWKCMDN